MRCTFCGCTEERACDVGGRGCAWISTQPPVCSAAACVEAFKARPASIKPIITAREILAPFTGKLARDLHDGLRLVEDLGLDSLDTVELWMDVEKVFGVTLSDESFNRASDASLTVGAYLAQVRRVTGRDDA